jgi:hypothetical protein
MGRFARCDTIDRIAATVTPTAQTAAITPSRPTRFPTGRDRIAATGSAAADCDDAGRVVGSAPALVGVRSGPGTALPPALPAVPVEVLTLVLILGRVVTWCFARALVCRTGGRLRREWCARGRSTDECFAGGRETDVLVGCGGVTSGTGCVRRPPGRWGTPAGTGREDTPAGTGREDTPIGTGNGLDVVTGTVAGVALAVPFASSGTPKQNPLSTIAATRYRNCRDMSHLPFAVIEA